MNFKKLVSKIISFVLVYNQILPPLVNIFIAFYISNLDSVSDKDDYAILITVIGLSLVFFGFNSKSIVQNKSNYQYKINIENSKFINLIFAALTTAVIYFLLPSYYLISAIITIHCLSEISIEFFKYNLLKKEIFISRTLKTLIDLSIFFYLIESYNVVESRLLALLFGSLIVLFIYPKRFLPNLNKFSIGSISQVFSYTLPLLVYSGSIIILSMGDRLILDYYEINDLYTYFLMSTLANGNILLTTAIMPVILNKYISKKNYTIKSDLLKWYAFIITTIILIFLFISIFEKFSVIEISHDWKLIYILLSLSTSIQIPYFFMIQKTLAVGNTKTLIPIGISGLIFNILFNFTLIPYLGLFGACIASIITSLILTIQSLRL